MINRRDLLVATGAAACLGLLASESAADEVDAVLAEISKSRATLKTLQASFKQQRVIGLLAAAVESKGRLLLVRPDRLRWELFPPDAVCYWIGPDGLAMRTGEGVARMGRAAAGRFGAVLGDLMTMLGGDVTKLRQRYALGVERTAEGLRLTARPTQAEVKKHVARLAMRTGKALWKVEQVQILETNGDQSVIDFSAVERDKPIDPTLLKP
jgi:outer membrane lipoprotein-sorting protein